ncbi:hypothetical protein BV898_03171 [Hypsibius exemplaris]|uniref:VWFC domain-containing protein n=1 Tax=Hypsibius exemplaris TaxID=2072580 RepID=A0A1W0X5Y2_HYPEX|nr:hypothetical protein BV898_03171 [Hypsibius exemplaris]
MTDISGTRQAFTGLIPIHMLPSNQIVDYFPWEVEIGLETCPYVGMLVRARRGASGNSSAETERLQDLWNYPSPHCSVECECMPTGDYQCRSVCPVPPADMDFCVPVEVPGQCCHKYVCDDDLDAAFPNLQFPEPQNTTIVMCLPGTILPDSVCHHTFPKAFSGHLGPKGICLDFDDIRCVWLEDNEIPVAATVVTGRTAKELTATVRRGRRTGKQTIFFQTAVNGTVFSTTVPLKTLRKRLDFGTTV